MTNGLENTLEEEFIPLAISLEIKELGFDQPCFRGWNKYGVILYHPDSDIVLDNPTFSQVFKWFREKHNLFGCIDLQVCNPPHWYIRIDDIIKNDYLYHSEDENLKFKTYEEAELSCLKQLINIVKNKNNEIQ